MAHLFVIAGHGAGDPGACGNGFSEAERVRALATRIKALGGENVTLGDFNRDYYADGGINSLNIPKDWEIAELHMDSAAEGAKGGHVIIKAGFTPDKYDNALASFIGGILPGRANLIVGRSDLANPNRAAARGYSYRLVEVGFITNAGDLSIFNNRMDDIARGILNAFGISSGNAPSAPAPTPNPTPAPSNPQKQPEIVFSYAVKAEGGTILPFVNNLSDYAGIRGKQITDVAIKVNRGSVKYRVHVKGEGWLPYVTGCNWNDHNNGYAGNGRVIDAIEVYYNTPADYAAKYGYQKAQYRVSPVNKEYYPWQYDNDKGNGQDGFAGCFGQAIDRFQLF